MNRVIKALLIALVGVSVSFSALANVGKTIYTIGNVTVEKPAVSKLSRGSIIEEGDVIVTGPKGYAQVKFADGSKVAIRPDSRFVVEAVEAPATATTPAIGKGTELKASFNLQKGGFRTITGGIARRDPASYQVSTPSAVIRVRGTLFQTVVCSANCGDSTDGTYVGVSNGGVSMTNGGGTVNLSKNQFGFAQSFNTPPTKVIAPPAILTDEGLANVQEESSDENNDDSGGSGGSGGSDENNDANSGGGSSGGGGEGEGGSGNGGSGSGGSGSGGSGNSGSGGSSGSIAANRGASVSTTATTTTSSFTSTGAGTTFTAPTTEVIQTITTVSDDGTSGPTDLTGGQSGPVVTDPTSPRGMAIAVGSRALGFETNNDTLVAGTDNNLTTFDEGTNTFDIGAANNLNTGFDPVSSIRWGRWGGGTATQTTNGTATNLDAAGLHWVVVAADDTIPTQVITGSVDYTLVGNTDPTDSSGNVGVLGSASFNADFTNSSVTSNLQLGINSQTWAASGSAPITGIVFNGLYDTVTVGGVTAGNTGSFGGTFGGFGTNGIPNGVGMAYQLSNGTTVVNGAAVFNNAGTVQ